jgi:gliding motility-associated-like protein
MIKKLLPVLIASLLFINLSAQQNGTCDNCLNGKSSTPKPFDGSGFLGATFTQDTCGLNYVQASVLTQTRSAQFNFNANGTGLPTTCNIAGLPTCSIIVRAYVWFIASYQSGVPPASTVSITNPNSQNGVFNAAMVGQGPSKCWGETGSAVYRADVTSNISGNGAYNIDITGFSNKNWEIDGVTLFIVYRDPLATYQGSLEVWDGNMTGNWGLQTQNITGFTACAASSAGNGFVLVSDMQSNVNGGSHPSTVNGNTQTYNNDFYNFDLANTTINNNQNNANMATDGLSGDCFTFAVVGIYYQTGNCVTCTPIPSSSFTVSTNITQPTCNNCNGSATATPNGGTAPYTYSWTTNPSQTGQAATGLCPGIYTVFAYDASGCGLGTDTITVSPSNAYTTTTSQTNVTCGGGNNGTATTTPVGGQSPFTYFWSTSPSQTTQVATGLTAGTYIVIITDGNGCTQSDTITITQPQPLIASTQPAGASCFGNNDGSAAAFPTGGSSPYTYSWSTSPSQTTQIATGLGAGTYSVVITDANGCSMTIAVIVTQPNAINFNSSSVGTNCFGGSDGTATITPSGGLPPFTYLWINNTQTTQTVTGLSAGQYVVFVTDANGCTVADTITVSQPPPPADTLTITAEFCAGDSIAVLHAPQGQSSYSWYYNSTLVGTGDSIVINNTNTAGYTVTWLLNGCIRITSAVLVTVPMPYFMPDDNTSNVFSPNGDNVNDVFYPYRSTVYAANSIEYYAKEFMMQIFDRWGKLMYETTDYNPQWDGRFNGKICSEGTYYWICTYINRCDPNTTTTKKGYVQLLRGK